MQKSQILHVRFVEVWSRTKPGKIDLYWSTNDGRADLAHEGVSPGIARQLALTHYIRLIGHEYQDIGADLVEKDETSEGNLVRVTIRPAGPRLAMSHYISAA